MYILKRIILICSLAFAVQSAQATVIYSNDFEGPIGDPYDEWSHPTTGTTPSGRDFLGQFSNGTVSLSLDNLAAHNFVTISFDLFIIESWDGNMDGVGPDEWSLNILGGPELLKATFSNTPSFDGHTQSYSPSGIGNDHPAYTGSSKFNSLGYSFHGDSTYRLAFTFVHTAADIQFNFSASGLQDISDESWGLDNVSVATSTSHSVPEPSSLLLFGAAIFGLLRRNK